MRSPTDLTKAISIKHILTFLLLAPLADLQATDALIVYPPVPERAASEHTKVRVRPVGDDNHRPY